MPRRGFGTRSVHPPPVPAQPGEPVAPLLDLSSTYSFSSAADFAVASEVKVGRGYVYGRWANPTVDAFEAAVADLEGAGGAEAFSSGMAAVSGVLLSWCSAGDRICAVRQLYGNTYSLMAQRLPRLGITTTFVDAPGLDGLEEAVDGAKLVYCETIGNPAVVVSDLDRLASAAASAGIPLIVDNTFASPILCRPLERGATVSLHSATKFLGGHHDLLGGIVCGEDDSIARLQSVTRDFGTILAPFNAWLALRGLATLHLRVERACASALEIARWLDARSDIDGISYPGLERDVSHGLAGKLLGGRGGGVIAMDVAGGRDRARRFQDSLRLILPAASLGGSHSLIVHAASVTHTQLSAEELAAAGISEGFCRLSVGLEDLADLFADLDQALSSTG